MVEYGGEAQSAFSEAIPSQPFPFPLPSQPQVAQSDLSTSAHPNTSYSSTASRSLLSPFPQPTPSSSFNFSFSSHPRTPLYLQPQPPPHPQQQYQQYQQYSQPPQYPQQPQQNFYSTASSPSFPYSAPQPSTSHLPLPHHDLTTHRNGQTIARPPHPQILPSISYLPSSFSPLPNALDPAWLVTNSPLQSHQTPRPPHHSSRHTQTFSTRQEALPSSLRQPASSSRPSKRVRIVAANITEDSSADADFLPSKKRFKATSSRASKELGPLGLSNTSLWPAEKDAKLMEGIEMHGLGNWDKVAKVAGMAKHQCSNRWKEARRKPKGKPKGKIVAFTEEEDQQILSLRESGRGWREIGRQLGRDGSVVRIRSKTLEGYKKKGLKVPKRRGFKLVKAVEKAETEGDSDSFAPSFTPPSIGPVLASRFDDPPPSFDDPLPFFDDSILQFGLIPDNSGFSPSFDLPLSPIFASSTFSSFAQPAPQSSDNFHFNKFIEFGIDQNDEGTGEMSFAGFGGSTSNGGDTGGEEDLGGYEDNDWSAMSREDIENDLMVWDGLTRVGDVGVGESRVGTMGAAAVFDLGENEVEMMDWRASEEEVGEEVGELGGSRESEESEREGEREEGKTLMESIDAEVNGGDGYKSGIAKGEDDELEEGEIREEPGDFSGAREGGSDSALPDLALSTPPFGFNPQFSQPGSSAPSRQGSFSYNSNGPQPSGLSAYPPPPPPPAGGSQLGSSPPGDQAPIYGGPQLGQQHQIILGRAVRGQESIAPGPAGPGYGNAFNPDVRSMRSPLLDEFRSNRNRTWELPVLAGHVVEFAGDPLGSRHIQQKLENATDAEKAMIFNEILPNMLQLSTDVFANHVIQKFFEKGSQAQKTAMAQVLEGQVLPLSLHRHGSRVVEKALEFVLVDQQVRLVRELEGHVLKCARDARSSHVVQRALERVPPEHLLFITDACSDEVYSLATHPYGCHVLECIFKKCPAHQTRALLNELRRYTQQLAQDQYGNYVIRWLIEKGETLDRSLVISSIYGHVLPLAQHKVASNVIEECIIHASEEERRRIIDELLAPAPDGSSNIKTMLADAFANYVVQQALKSSGGAQREAIYLETATQLSDIRKDSNRDQRYPVSVEKLLESERQRNAISK